MKKNLSKILKIGQKIEIPIIKPNLSLVEEESFRSLFEININDRSKELKILEEKAREEGFEKGYKEGFNKGYLEGHKKGYQEGFEKGKQEAENRYKKLEAKLQQDFQEKIQSVVTFLKNLEKETKDLIINMDKEVLNLAFEIAKKLVLKEIEIDKEVPLRIIREALNYIAEGTELNIKVNPEQHRFLEENLSKYVPPSQKVKLIPDSSISKGEVFIETSLGVIDATFEKRWKKLVETLVKDES